MTNRTPTVPASSTDQMTSVLEERHLQVLDAAFQFMRADTHARILSEAEPVKPATMASIHVRGLAEPGSSAYQPD